MHCPIDLQGHLSIFKVTRLKNRRFRAKLGVSGLYLQFEFTDGYEMMHKDWRSIEEVPYCFSRFSVKLQGHRAKKISTMTQDWDFSDYNSNSNSQMAMKWCSNLEVARSGVLLFFKVVREISMSQGTNIADFERNWAFPDCHSSWIHRWLWYDVQSLK